MARSSRKTSAYAAAEWIIRELQVRGHTAYLAGGCVRDELMGLEPKDYDVATDAHPEVVKKVFPRSRAVGEAFGVVLVEKEGHAVEVATFRNEWGYADGRRPTYVDYTDAQHDAMRRDFTVNGLFEDPLAKAEEGGGRRGKRVGSKRGRVIDYVGGVVDIRNKVIRAIGEPEQRLGEDFLRMLRAVRFAARFGFEIESGTAAAIRGQAENLGKISRERIGQELRWMFAGRRADVAVGLMQELGLDGPVLNDACMVTGLRTLKGVAVDASFSAKLAAWMVDRHLEVGRGQKVERENRKGVGRNKRGSTKKKVEAQWEATERAIRLCLEKQARELVRRWRVAVCLSNDERDELRDILEVTVAALGWGGLAVSKQKRLMMKAGWGGAMALMGGLRWCVGMEPNYRKIRLDAKELEREGISPEPWVTGQDLILMGEKPGPAFGRLLEMAYDLQLEERLASRDEALQWLGRQVSR